MSRTALLRRDKYIYSVIAHKCDIKVCTPRTKVMGICKGNVKRAKTEIHGNIVQVSDFVYLVRMVLEVKRDTDVQLQK
jgi:hypothetical protein